MMSCITLYARIQYNKDNGSSLSFSVGLEHADDLVADLKHALDKVQ